MASLWTHYVALCCLPEQTSERDDRRHAGAVEEQDGGQTLQTEGVSDVAPVERQLPLDVQDQTSEYPGGGEREILIIEFSSGSAQ